MFKWMWVLIGLSKILERDSFSSEIMQRISDKIQPRLTFQYLSDWRVFVPYSDLTDSEEILISI